MPDVRAEMERGYPDFVNSVRRARLNPSTVPVGIQPYVPLAELWGTSRDESGEQLVDRAPPEALRHLARSLRDVDSALDAWLSGSEANSAHPTPEYVAFSVTRIAFEYARAAGLV